MSGNYRPRETYKGRRLSMVSVAYGIFAMVVRVFTNFHDSSYRTSTKAIYLYNYVSVYFLKILFVPFWDIYILQ